jgi:hypothetical protein
MMSSKLIPSVCFALMLMTIPFNAQDRPFGQGPGRGGPGGRPGGPPFGPPASLDFLSTEIRMDGPVVKGAPYSATAITENIQTLADGTRIVNKTTAAFARDGEGRLRREVTLSFAGPFRVEGDPPRLIFINDFGAGVRYVLNPQSRQARKFSTKQAGAPPPDVTPPAAGQSRTESLGRQTIEGIEVVGVRSIITIPIGQMGNDRPIEIVSERWESPELEIVVLSKHRDPRFGETTYRLNNIKRGEPARSLFEVPADYKLEEGGPPFGPPARTIRKPE